jgi:hypothetical protein
MECGPFRKPQTPCTWVAHGTHGARGMRQYSHSTPCPCLVDDGECSRMACASPLALHDAVGMERLSEGELTDMFAFFDRSEPCLAPHSALEGGLCDSGAPSSIRPPSPRAAMAPAVAVKEDSDGDSYNASHNKPQGVSGLPVGLLGSNGLPAPLLVANGAVFCAVPHQALAPVGLDYHASSGTAVPQSGAARSPLGAWGEGGSSTRRASALRHPANLCMLIRCVPGGSECHNADGASRGAVSHSTVEKQRRDRINSLIVEVRSRTLHWTLPCGRST